MFSRNVIIHTFRNIYDETKEVTISGGEIAGNARKELEAKLGRTVISCSNATTPELLDDSKNKNTH